YRALEALGRGREPRARGDRDRAQLDDGDDAARDARRRDLAGAFRRCTLRCARRRRLDTEHLRELRGHDPRRIAPEDERRAFESARDQTAADELTVEGERELAAG